MPKPKHTLTFQIPEKEREVLIKYCEQEQRTQSDVLRELVRSLKDKIGDKPAAIEKTTGGAYILK